MLVECEINKVSEDELERDGIEVFEEDAEKLSKDLSEIKQWIESTPHMRKTRKDELFLRLFLRGCNYNVKDTKEKLDMYFTCRYKKLFLIYEAICNLLHHNSILMNFFN